LEIRHMMIPFLVLAVSLSLLQGCAKSKYSIDPELKPFQFQVMDDFGTLNYTPITDNRQLLEVEGQSGPDNLILGDDDYDFELIPIIEQHLRSSLEQSGLFSSIIEGDSTRAEFTYKASLDRFFVMQDKTKISDANQMGCIGMIAAQSTDVPTTTEIRITASLIENSTNKELWRKIVTKKIDRVDVLRKTTSQTTDSMSEAISSCCNELVTEIAKFMASM
jgi:hypothetical protein